MDLQDLPPNLRRNLEKTVESIVNKHESFNSKSYVISVDSVVEDIMKTDEVKEITEQIMSELSLNDESSMMSSFEESECFNPIAFNLVADKKVWAQKSKILRDQLLSRDNQVFLTGYITHYHLITNPETINEGTMNLIKTLKTFFFTVTKQFSPYGHCKNIKHNFQRNMLRIIHMLFKALARISLNHKIQHIQNIVVQLMELANGTICNDKLHFLNYAAIIDPEANWFKKLITFKIYRNVIIDYLRAHTNLMEYFANEIFFNVYNEMDFSFRHIIIDMKVDVKFYVIKTATMFSYMNILAQIFSACSENLFPSNFKLNGDRVSVLVFIKFLLNAANNLSNDQLQLSKHRAITLSLKNFFVSQNEFLSDIDVQQKFILPLRLNENSRNLLIVCRKYFYVFEICSEISKTENGFYILFGCSPDKKFGRRKSTSSLTEREENLEQRIKKFFGINRENSIADAIINFTTSFIKYLSNNKKFNNENCYIILNYCMDILTCKQHIIYWYKCDKLVLCLKDYYNKITTQTSSSTLSGESGRYSSHLKYIERALYIFCTSPRFCNVIFEDRNLLSTFGSRYISMNCNLWEIKHFTTLLTILCENAYGTSRDNIFEKKDYLLFSYLNKIWQLLEDEISFLSGSDRMLNELIFKFLKVIMVLTLNLKCCQIMFREDDPTDKIIVERDRYPVNLAELIQYAMTISGPGNTINFVALSALNILIMNLDIYLYLEYKFDLEENLTKMQNECVIEGSKDNTIIIDECSILRQDILKHIRSMALPRCSPLSTVKSSSSVYRKQINELHRCLKETKHSLHDNNWLAQIRKAHKLSLNEVLKENIIFEIISQLKLFNHNNRTNKYTWPFLEMELKELSPEEVKGASIIYKYAVQNKILPSCSSHDSLLLLLRQANYFVRSNGAEQKTPIRFTGFDWFVGLVFLFSGGQIDKCKVLLSTISELPVGLYIWPALRFQEPKQFWTRFECNIEVMLNNMNLDSVFEYSNLSAVEILEYVLNNCFLNILEWNEICHLLVYILTNPPEYLSYYLVSMLNYIKMDVINSSVSHENENFEKILSFKGFKLKEAMPAIDQMAKQYKNLFYGKK